MNQKERKEGCGLKYRVVSILKDNRPRFLIISDIEEIEILPSKYLKHLDQINASPNTVKSAAFALSYYYIIHKEVKMSITFLISLTFAKISIKHFLISLCFKLIFKDIIDKIKYKKSIYTKSKKSKTN